MEEKLIKIYTDGCCLKNPGGAGGYAAIVISDDNEYELSGGITSTTNNRMEILAAIVGIESIKVPVEKIEIYSDSQYLVNSINKGWLSNWKKNGQLDSRPNSDLWKRLLPLLKRYRVSFHWVKGHANDYYNNRADELAGEAALIYKGMGVEPSKPSGKSKKSNSTVNMNDPEFQRFMWNFYKKYKNKLNF